MYKRLSCSYNSVICAWIKLMLVRNIDSSFLASFGGLVLRVYCGMLCVRVFCLFSVFDDE